MFWGAEMDKLQRCDVYKCPKDKHGKTGQSARDKAVLIGQTILGFKGSI